MKYIHIILFLIITLNCFSQSMTITYRGGESKTDKRMEYPLALLTYALEITKEEYGDYQLVPSPRMNSKRAENPLVVDSLENYIVEASVTDKTEEELLSIKIPTTKGLYGYRVFLITSENKYMFQGITSLNSMKTLKLGQGSTWFDVKILEDSGLEVIKGLNYDGLLKMLVHNRFDAFPRGINEAFKEVELQKENYPNLIVEENICVYYPLPKFFYTSKKSAVLNERVTKGLLLMIENGTFDKIWSDFNYKYVLEADLENRTIIYLKNRYVPQIVPFDDPKFWYIPN